MFLFVFLIVAALAQAQQQQLIVCDGLPAFWNVSFQDVLHKQHCTILPFVHTDLLNEHFEGIYEQMGALRVQLQELNDSFAAADEEKEDWSVEEEGEEEEI